VVQARLQSALLLEQSFMLKVQPTGISDAPAPANHALNEALRKDIAGNGFVRAKITDLLLPKLFVRSR
jgi:hypothetical protein